MIQASGQFVPLKLDVDQKTTEPLADRYKIDVIPAILFLDADGKIVSQFTGSVSPKEMIAKMNEAIRKTK